MMNCPSRERILEAVHGAADDVQSHVAACAACRALYDGMMSATEILSSTPLSGAGDCLDENALAGYVRHALTPDREAGVESHLAACASCRDEMVALVDALDADAGAAPGGLEDRVRALAPCPPRERLFEAAHGLADDAADHARSCASCGPAFETLRKVGGILLRTPFSAAEGKCLDETSLICYARRNVLPEREAAVETHLSQCAACRAEAVALVDALDAEPADVPESLARRVRSLVGPSSSSSARLRRITQRVPSRRPVPVFVWAAAAVVLFAVVVLILIPQDRPVQGPVAKERPRPAPVAKEDPKPAPELPKKEEPRVVQKTETPKPVPPPELPTPKKEEPKVAVETPKPEFPKRIEPPAPTPPFVVKEPDKKETPKPSPVPPTETKVEVKVARYQPLRVLDVVGVLRRKGAADALAKGAALARGDELVTDHRHVALMTAEGGFTVAFEKDSACAFEQQEGGETRISMQKGRAFFTVTKRAASFVVATPSADAIVVGTAFLIEADEKHTLLTVAEGTVRLRNDKGEVLVNANQRALARPGVKPTAPARADAQTETAWTRRPDLLGEARTSVWIDHVQGGNKKYNGLVIAHPYYDGEPDSGRMAKLLSESMDTGLILGHNHRNMGLKIWMNVDRGMECEVRDDGTRGALQVTPRMKKYTDEYLEHMKAAAGLTPKQAVPMVVCFREHTYPAKGGGPLDVCEVAWIGFQRKTIEQFRALYAQLLDKHKPAYRMEMRFEGLDDRYMLRGVEQTFRLTESDAESDGYLAARHAQAGMTFFLSAEFGTDKTDFDTYPKIFAELIDFLWSQRRR